MKYFEAGGWTDKKDAPAEDLGLTLVANGDPDGRNPSIFHPAALRISTHKGFQRTGLNTRDLINHGRCSMVAHFFRRVQEVIWNRRLMRTYDESGKPGRLGLVYQDAQEGDLLRTFYGCSVPIVLQRLGEVNRPDQIRRRYHQSRGSCKDPTAIQDYQVP